MVKLVWWVWVAKKAKECFPSRLCWGPGLDSTRGSPEGDTALGFESNAATKRVHLEAGVVLHMSDRHQ